MCKVNYVYEFNSIMRYARNNGMPLRERMLWIALFYIANERAAYNEQTKEYDWPEDFISVANGELTLYSTLDKRAIDTLRNSLKQRGLIDFVPGLKKSRVPAYKINYLSLGIGCKTVPNDVPNRDTNHAPNGVPNDAPNRAPNQAPYPKDIYNNHTTEVGGGGKQDSNTGQGGFVDLSGGNPGFSGLIPFPGEEAVM